jgi:hypothetical protein
MPPDRPDYRQQSGWDDELRSADEPAEDERSRPKRVGTSAQLIVGDPPQLELQHDTLPGSPANQVYHDHDEGHD